MTITDVANITTGLTNRVEICVINNINTYGFNINRSYDPKCVEKPRLPSLIVMEGGIVQNGLCEQTNLNKQNAYEIIPHTTYKYVKELLGYVGLSTNNYDIYKVINKYTETDVSHIDCGSTSSLDIDGTVYTKDIGIGGTTQKTYSNIAASGNLEPIYQTSRSGNNLNWRILTKNTTHRITLRFADFWPGDRKFDIIINNNVRHKNLSINNIIGGPFKRFDLDLKVPVTNEIIDITIAGDGQLNAIDIHRLDKKGDVEFVEATRDDVVSNKDIYLFLNKNINISETHLKKKFLEIQNHILPSRNIFFY